MLLGQHKYPETSEEDGETSSPQEARQNSVVSLQSTSNHGVARAEYPVLDKSQAVYCGDGLIMPMVNNIFYLQR